MKAKAEDLKVLVSDKFSDEKLFEGFVESIYGEEVNVEEWITELEGSFIE